MSILLTMHLRAIVSCCRIFREEISEIIGRILDTSAYYQLGQLFHIFHVSLPDLARWTSIQQQQLGGKFKH